MSGLHVDTGTLAGIVPPRAADARSEALRRPADAVDRLDARGRAGDRASLREGQGRHPGRRVAVLRALREGDQRAEGPARRGHPGAQLPDAGDLPLRRRRGRRQPAARAAAAKADADIIVQCGVHFMAETSKILSPDKTVLIPDSRAGCSLAASITGADVRLLKRALSRRAGRHLRQHLGRREGRERHLLHLVQRRAGGREPGRRPRDLPAGRVSRRNMSRRRPR